MVKRRKARAWAGDLAPCFQRAWDSSGAHLDRHRALVYRSYRYRRAVSSHQISDRHILSDPHAQYTRQAYLDAPLRLLSHRYCPHFRRRFLSRGRFDLELGILEAIHRVCWLVGYIIMCKRAVAKVEAYDHVQDFRTGSTDCTHPAPPLVPSIPASISKTSPPSSLFARSAPPLHTSLAAPPCPLAPSPPPRRLT